MRMIIVTTLFHEYEKERIGMERESLPLYCI